MYDKVEFKVYNETDKVWLVAENLDGIYYVTGYTADENIATVFVPIKVSDEVGKVKVFGVEDDVYTIIETKTADGYTLLEDDVELSIVFENEKPTASIAGKAVEMNADKQSQNAMVAISVVNDKIPDLPVTGDTGMVMIVAIGVIIMTGAVITVVKINHKKNND